MKITVRQLKQLIKEQVGEAMGWTDPSPEALRPEHFADSGGGPGRPMNTVGKSF